jgi:uncharacterized protein with HEPN domain
MLDAARESLQFSEGRTRRDLETDRMLVLAVLKDIEILGEAASRVTQETRGIHPEIPWQDIIRMRNRLIHGYFDVNLDIVWDTLRNDLPPLVRMLEQALMR